MAAKLSRCAEALSLELRLREGEPVEARLKAAHFCRLRFCPWCEWRKATAWRRRLIPGLQAFGLEHPKHRAVLLTLTVRNVRASELRGAVGEIHASWKRLTKRRGFPTSYWLRRTELTLGRPPSSPDIPQDPRLLYGAGRRLKGIKHTDISDNELTNNELKNREVWVHPHLHALLLVPPRYWAADYIRQSLWREWWMESARLDYAPIVDVRKAYRRKGERTIERESIAAAIEAAKYTAKPDQLAALGPQLVDLTEQLRKVRMIAVSRPLSRFVRPDDPAGDELTDPLAEGDERAEWVHAIARWDEQTAHYQFDP